jgi:molybdenum cofactor biosynthesis enzyme MoaA
MSMDLFENILAQAATGGMHRIRFVGLGEPLLHPELPSMIRRAKEKGFYTEVSTNATLLTATLGAALLDAGLDEIGFSLDSADESEFARIRKGASYTEVTSNIEAFLAVCAERKRSAPITVARMVIMEGSDVEAFSRRWSNRVDSLQFNQLRVYSNTGSAASVKRGIIAAPSPTQIRRKVRCRQVLHHLLVHWDGTVGLCNQTGWSVGDANQSSLEDIWRGYALQKVRSLHNRFYVDCPRWWCI